MAVRRRRFRIVAAFGHGAARVAGAGGTHRRYQHPGRVGVRARGEHVLPAVPVGHLVAAAHVGGRRAGIITGGLLAVGAIVAGVLVGAQSAGGAVNALLTQPAIITVPVAFAAMIAVRWPPRVPGM